MYRSKWVGFVQTLHHHEEFEQPLIEVLTVRSLNQSFLGMGYSDTDSLWKTPEENISKAAG